MEREDRRVIKRQRRARRRAGKADRMPTRVIDPESVYDRKTEKEKAGKTILSELADW